MARVLLLLLLGLCGCRAAEGERCARLDDCEEGLVCGGDANVCQACERSSGCETKGLCAKGSAAKANECVATAAGCEASKMCRESGLCALGNAGSCVASAAGCKASSACRSWGSCQLVDGVCAAKSEPPKGDGLGLQGVGEGGGCPCGCDHSHKLLAELSQLPPEEARDRANASLDVIAQREQRGYITEAMLQHRARLRAFLEDGRGGARRASDGPGRRQLFALQGDRAEARGARLAVEAEVALHGQIVERIHGRDKLQRACFVVRLALEGEAELPLPEVVASYADQRRRLEPTRWYRLGSDGAPWDGRLRGREELLLVGYFDEPVQPGTAVALELRVGDATLALESTTRQRWDLPSAAPKWSSMAP